MADNNIINIDDKNFEIIGEWIINVPDDFTKIKKHDGSGGKKLFISQDEWTFREFFEYDNDEDSTFNCFFLKENLIEYMTSVKDIYKTSFEDYNKKEEMPDLYDKHIDEIKSNEENFLKFKAKPAVRKGPLRFYINSEDVYYSKIRDMAIPSISRFFIFKLKDSQCNINYYFKIIRSEDELCVKKEFENFDEFLKHYNFYFDSYLIENFLLSLKVKPFIIFTGNSGTGKTKLAQLFAKYLSLNFNFDCGYQKIFDDIYNEEDKFKNVSEDYFSNLTEMEANNYQLISVGANWTDNRNILGYYNIVEKNYSYTPSYFLIKLANKFYKYPFFLILDEMNLSHVEMYFSDFLSSIESNTRINLQGKHEKLNITINLKIIGTVNVDETTYMFSPKVLDRANVIEVETVPVEKYMGEIENINEFKGNIQFLENRFSKVRYYKDTGKKDSDGNKIYINKVYNIPTMDIEQLKEYIKGHDEDLWKNLKDELNKFQSKLEKSGFDFGFRVIDEILRFMVASLQYEEGKSDNWERYFDAQIMQKILPKLHGSQNMLGNTLEELLKLCTKDNEIPKDRNDMKKYKYDKSASKILKMIDNLNKKHYVSFMS